MVLKIAEALHRIHREDKGFTLIELLIVIAILAVLAAIAIPLVTNRIDDAREAADRSNVRTLQGVVDLYYLDEGYYPDDLEGLEDDFLREPVISPYPDLRADGDYNGYDYNDETGEVTSRAVGIKYDAPDSEEPGDGDGD